MQAMENGDIRSYTIEVHSLKSTSRQIGADHLSGLAARLEKAGNYNDAEFIRANTDELIVQYHAVRGLIAPVFPELMGAMTLPAEQAEPAFRPEAGGGGFRHRPVRERRRKMAVAAGGAQP